MEKPKRNPRILNFILIIPAVLGLLAISARAQDVQLQPNPPERYTVKKGDTLWDISGRFLKSPWQWPRVWKNNDQIKNPHLIYPGDVIVFRYVDGKPELTVLRNEKVPLGEATPEKPGADTTPAPGLPPPASASSGRTDKIRPQIYVEPIGGAIPTVPPNAILPFLTNPLVVDKNELEKAGYITVGLEGRIALGDQSEFYARGLQGNDEYFQIFRAGKAIRHPDTNEVLGYEALYLGDARMLEPGDPAKLKVTSVKQEIIPTDRLLAASPRASLPYYYPSAPSTQVNGRIVSALNAIAEIGALNVVGISLGKREGIEEGHVLRVMRHAGKHRDPVSRGSYMLPDEESGLIMVFRVFDKMSYALVMRATQPVHMLDAVVTP